MQKVLKKPRRKRIPLPAISFALLNNNVWLQETANLRIPSIQICDTQARYQEVDFPIIANSRSVSFSYFMIYLLGELVSFSLLNERLFRMPLPQSNNCYIPKEHFRVKWKLLKTPRKSEKMTLIKTLLRTRKKYSPNLFDSRLVFVRYLRSLRKKNIASFKKNKKINKALIISLLKKQAKRRSIHKKKLSRTLKGKGKRNLLKRRPSKVFLFNHVHLIKKKYLRLSTLTDTNKLKSGFLYYKMKRCLFKTLMRIKGVLNHMGVNKYNLSYRRERNKKRRRKVRKLQIRNRRRAKAKKGIGKKQMFSRMEPSKKKPLKILTFALFILLEKRKRKKYLLKKKRRLGRKHKKFRRKFKRLLINFLKLFISLT